MNLQIQKLVEQSGMTRILNEHAHEYGNGLFETTEYPELVKFAELIVRECADVAYKTSWDDLVHGYGQAVIPLHLHNTIKEHFGVEE